MLLHKVHQFVLNNWPITLFTRKNDSREQMKYMYDAEPIFYQTSIVIASNEKFVSTHLLNWDYKAHISRGFPPSYKQCQPNWLSNTYSISFLSETQPITTKIKHMYQRSVTSDCWVYAMSVKICNTRGILATREKS